MAEGASETGRSEQDTDLGQEDVPLSSASNRRIDHIPLFDFRPCTPLASLRLAPASTRELGPYETENPHEAPFSLRSFFKLAVHAMADLYQHEREPARGPTGPSF